MQMVFKNGKKVQLSEQQIREILHKYKEWSENEVFQKMDEYFKQMHKKAHINLQMISNYTIDTEKDMKDALVVTMKYGTRADVADFIIQAIECKVSKMILQSSK